MHNLYAIYFTGLQAHILLDKKPYKKRVKYSCFDSYQPDTFKTSYVKVLKSQIKG